MLSFNKTSSTTQQKAMKFILFLFFTIALNMCIGKKLTTSINNNNSNNYKLQLLLITKQVSKTGSVEVGSY